MKLQPASFLVNPASAPSYPVFSGGDIPQQALALAKGYRQVVVVGDVNTAQYAEPIAKLLTSQHQVLSFRLAVGDGNKTRAQKERLEDAMLAAGIDRQALVVAVGGGVVCDLAGFVAGSYMRGIGHINVATTLLCQVDAAIGGKTAVNTPLAKNSIGMFHQPRAVIMHHAALATLPARELRGGLAEAIKQAALSPDDLFAVLSERLLARTDTQLDHELVLRCAKIKADVVAEDDKDRGVRQLLNFGHTVGHALERATDHLLSHGEAVSIGMLMEARAASAAGTFPAADIRRLTAALEAAELPTTPPCEFDAAWPFMLRDKKNQGASVMMAVPPKLSSRACDGPVTQQVSAEQLQAVWR